MSRWVMSFLEGVQVERGADVVTISRGESVWGLKMSFKSPSPGMMAAFERLEGPGATSGELAALMMSKEGFAGLGRLKALERQLEEHGYLAHAVYVGDRRLLSLRATSLSFRSQRSLTRDRRVVLSRFAELRRDAALGFVLWSPTAHARVTLDDAALLGVVGKLGQPTTAAELAGAEGLDEDTLLMVLDALGNAGGLSLVSDDGAPAEDAHPALGQWSPADLAFHASSRLGRNTGAYGATFRHSTRFPPVPVVKPPMSGELVPLFRPDLERLKREERSFTSVQEERRSVREYGPEPISVAQLGELLYRTARIKKIVPEAGVSWRPAAGGGALHELEIYPVVANCRGLSPGLYHYDPLEHALSRVPSDARREKELEHLVQLAARTGMLEQPPQVLLVVAARFQRVQSKYESVAYSVILKNVGCLYQSIYLVAEAMGLATCALGGGDADLFARVAGLDYFAETSVGEMLLGSGPLVRPEPLAPPKGVMDGRPRWT